MTKRKLLLTGLLAGAVAFGTACKTDKGNTNTGSGTDTTTMDTDAGTGGTGYSNPDTNIYPLPREGTREMEPGVHEGDTHEEPGTGGTGMEQEPIDRSGDDSLGGETGSEPRNPGAPANQPNPNQPNPNEGGMNGGEDSDLPRH